MRKNIVYIVNSLKNGGPVNVLYTLVKYIDKTKFNVTVVALKMCKEANCRNFSELDCTVIIMPKMKWRNLVRTVQMKMTELKPDIIHSHGGMADIINTKIIGSHNSFSTIHCNPDEDFVMRKGKFIGWMKATAFMHTIKKIEYPISCSETVANKILKQRKVKTRYIRNGVDLERLNNTKNFLSRSELNIREEDIVLVFCGYLSKGKNVKFIFDVLKEIHRDDIKLLVLGDGPDYEKLSERSKEDRRILMMGRIRNPYEYLSVGDYFISASLSEGFPLAVMEGLVCGLPTILSDIESHRELSRSCPSMVSLFDLSKSASLINHLNEISFADRSSERESIQYFDARRMADEYSDIYFDAIDKKL